VTITRCTGCARRYTGTGKWSAKVTSGVVVGVLCPDCASAEGNTETEITTATITHERHALGRRVGSPGRRDGQSS
jgi:hypothetical protein